jgi:septum formation protein
VDTKSNTFLFKLASGSPRRKELIEIAGWHTLLQPVRMEEKSRPKEDPISLAKRLAFEKAEKAADEDGMIVLGADTIVVLGDQILGKPQDERNAAAMLGELNGRIHQVITAIALVDRGNDQFLVDLCMTDVPMRNYSRGEVEAYIATGSPMDKAGAYGIQDRDFHPVDIERMKGCFANVMGLPLCHLARSLKRMGVISHEDIHEKCMKHTQYNCQVYTDILQRSI